MEHSLLHGLQLCGLIFALGGVLFRILVLGPVSRKSSLNSDSSLQSTLRLWIYRAALAGALACGIDIFVQVAELDGRTIYGGIKLSILQRYLLATTVGNLALAKMGLMALAAALSRDQRKIRWTLMLVVLLAATIAFTLVSHSAAVPEKRVTAVLVQLIHICGASFWLGMLAFVLLSAVHLKHPADSELLVAIVKQFSPFALISAVAICCSGLYSASRFIYSPGAIPVSAYGLTLILKLTLFAIVLYAAFLNWKVIRPALETAAQTSERPAIVARFLRLLELELTAGVLVLLVAGILGAISPPLTSNTAQLTPSQTQALLSPRIPPTKLVDPRLFVGAPNRTDDDLRYAEFTHQWSGLFVAVLGLCWIGQSLTARSSRIFGRIWPALLIPFGCFITVAADPEVWLMRSVSVREILSNGQLLEHQIGAVLVFILAVLGWRDAKRETRLRPLGYSFPILILAGSLMLLGHAHNNLGATEELTSLVNTEHAIIGALGLIAGAARWIQLRQLPGARPGKMLWAPTITALGIFMAFFYRELTPPVGPPKESSRMESMELVSTR